MTDYEFEDDDAPAGALAPRAGQSLAAADTGSVQLVAGFLQTALDRGADAESLEKLVSLYERVEAVGARKAYYAAHAAMQAELSPVVHNTVASMESDRGKWSYTYAKLDHLERVLKPYLVRHGFSYTWGSELADDTRVLRVTCTLRHEMGHSEASTFPAFIGQASKRSSATQEVKKAETYGQRQSLCSVIGVSTGAAHDDDGAGLGVDLTPISVDQYRDLQDLLQGLPEDTAEGLCAYLECKRLEEIPAMRFEKARRAMLAKRKKEGLR